MHPRRSADFTTAALLTDLGAWKQWAARGANTAGPWAPIPIPAAPKVLVPTAQTAVANWRYTLAPPADDWFEPGIVDSSWKEGPAGFGTKGTPGAVVRTEWPTKEIWLRREFALPDCVWKNPVLLVHYDEDPDVYINGVLAARLKGWTTACGEVELPAAAAQTLKPGRNLIAIRARQSSGGQYIDAGLAERGRTLAVRRLMDIPCMK